MTTHVMLDLETFGSAIASLGAVAFDPSAGTLGPELYMLVDPASCVAAGLAIDGDTFLWWLKQSDEARSALTEGRRHALPQALDAFSLFWTVTKASHLWGHGANFDDPVLAATYRATGRQPPWRYANSRCTRTIFDLAGVTVERAKGVHHNALDDAKAQALAVIAAFRALARTSPLIPEQV